MPPKRGKKRKTFAGADAPASAANDNDALSPPDRSTWPGWVEMESEPAFFNVMLKEMGVRGVKIQEVYSMDPDMLAVLPRPVHALIFLFRYRTEDQQEQEPNEDTDHIWFANQIPDFACATVALLNIVNNIPDLEMGKELRDFKDFTKDMDPITKGDMIDSFEFVKRIHNSFARENDLLNADMHMKGKIANAKKREAAAKARATKEAKKVAQTPLKDTSANTTKSARVSARAKKTITKVDAAPSAASTAASTAASKSTRSQPSSAGASPNPEDDADADADADYGSGAKNLAKATTNGVGEVNFRRSARTPKPRVNLRATQAEEDASEEGFHFIAYIPIGDHVWKLDGLNYYPTDIGSFGASGTGADGGTGNWIDAASPSIMNRMLQFQGAEIEFNLMAVVHDPAINDKNELLENIKAIQTLDTKLSSFAEDWSDMEGAETKKDVVTSTSLDFGIAQVDIDTTELPVDRAAEIATQDDILALITLRQRVITQQTALRAGLRDAISSSKSDDDKARHRRHDYGAFVRGWLGALAEQEVLKDLVNEV